MCIVGVMTSFPALPRKLATKMVDRMVAAITTVKSGSQIVCTEEQVNINHRNKTKLVSINYVNVLNLKILVLMFFFQS